MSAFIIVASIAGREKNLFKVLSGEIIVPRPNPVPLFDLGLRHCKLVQRTLTDIDFLYVPKDPAAELPRERAQAMVDGLGIHGHMPQGLGNAADRERQIPDA